MPINLAPTLADAFKQIRAFVAERPLSKFADSRGGTLGGTHVICCDNPSIPSIGWSCYRIATDESDQILLDENGEQREEAILVQVDLRNLEFGDLSTQEIKVLNTLLRTSSGKQRIATLLAQDKPFTLGTEDWVRFEQEEIDQLLPEFEPLKEAFLEATITHVKDWTRHQADVVVVGEADWTLGLTETRLRKVWEGVHIVIEDTRRAVEEALDRRYLWWHLQDPLPIIDPYSTGGTITHENGLSKRETHKWNYDTRHDYKGMGVPEFMDLEIRNVLSRLGKMLKNFGYLKDNPFWNPSFKGTFQWSQDMRDVLGVYSEKQYDVNTRMGTISRLKQNEKMSEAEKRWKEASTNVL